MTSNPLSRRSTEVSDSGPRFAYVSPEFLAAANIRCSRPELEWVYDPAGNMKLQYRRQGRLV